MSYTKSVFDTLIPRAISEGEKLSSTLKGLQMYSAYSPGAMSIDALQNHRDLLNVLLSALRTHLPAATTEPQTYGEIKSPNTLSDTPAPIEANAHQSAANMRIPANPRHIQDPDTGGHGCNGCEPCAPNDQRGVDEREEK